MMRALVPLALSLTLLTFACQAPQESRVSRWSGGGADVVGKEYGYFSSGAFKREGKAVYWFDSGQKYKQGRYADGEPTGPWTFWFQNGVKAAEGSFTDGNMDGAWTRWDETGKTIAEATFENGRLVDGAWIPLPDLTGMGSGRRELDLGWDDRRNEVWMSNPNNYLNPRRSEFWNGHPSRVQGVTPEVLVQIKTTRNE